VGALLACPVIKLTSRVAILFGRPEGAHMPKEQKTEAELEEIILQATGIE
jgi:hypothetical protein